MYQIFANFKNIVNSTLLSNFNTIFKYQVFIIFTSISPGFLIHGDLYISLKCSYTITHNPDKTLNSAAFQQVHRI